MWAVHPDGWATASYDKTSTEAAAEDGDDVKFCYFYYKDAKEPLSHNLTGVHMSTRVPAITPRNRVIETGCLIKGNRKRKALSVGEWALVREDSRGW